MNFRKNICVLPAVAAFLLLCICAAHSSAETNSSPALQGEMKWFDNSKSLEESKKYTIGSLDPESGYEFQVELISEAAAINTVKLANYFATDLDKRCEIVKWAQRIIMEDAPQLCLYYEAQIHAKRREVKDFTISVTERVDQLHKTWLDE